jgi:hypothetical protein
LTTRLAERRRNDRLPAAYPATITDRQGRFLAKGRTTNISAQGTFVLAGGNALEPDQIVVIEMGIPVPGKPSQRRAVAFACRIVRRQQIGQLVGVGVEFLRKVR